MTYIATGSAQARKLYSVALFAETQRRHTWRKTMTGSAPKQAAAEAKLKTQSSPDMPFIAIRDLSSVAGDTVSVDLVNLARIRPTMGDRKLAGRLGRLSFSSMDLKINQCRFGMDTGGRMSQKRTVHQLRGLCKANLVGQNAAFEDQLALIHVGGARGYSNDLDWTIPLASDPEFTEICVNTILPPSYNRRVLAGGGDTITNIGTSDYLALADIDRLRVMLDESPVPTQPIRLEGDVGSDENPLYVLYVTPRQWHYLQTTTGDTSWRTFIQNAVARAKDFKSGTHPLFSGQPGMWNGILIKKMSRAIRFAAADLCAEYASDGTTINNTAAPQPVDRAILLGGQALAICYGASGKSGFFYDWHEELEDHENVLEVSTAAVNGFAKVRFTGSDGAPTDFGVWTVDSYAPAIA